MKTITIKAETREKSGKEAARKLRAQGYAPAVFYGFNMEPVKLAFDTSELIKSLGGDRPEGTFVKLKINDNGADGRLSIIKDLQIDTVKRSILHADFYEIKMDREITLDLSVSLKGDPVGVESGGELQILKREVKVSGLPGILPEMIELDVSGLNIGDTIKVGDISLGREITVLDGEDVALVTVAKTRSALPVEEEAEAGVEEGPAEETPGEEE
ncbi:MAG: 50S ribosomal protein L25 [Syntrophales bacterium]|jgi:large subunit ribosomal protein L25|nr:50S ribosomal protein L25 [Syntrophales bacterium]MDY0043477.1 50S ribosomal protein L25 [Syntrophales bacterium]